MTWNMQVTTTFAPLPTAILDIIKENRYPKDQIEIDADNDGLFNNAALSSGFYFNKEQKYCHRPEDGLSSYLTAAIGNTNLHSVLFSGNQPAFGTSTRGFLKDKDGNTKGNQDNFRMQFLPDSNQPSDGMRGKFDNDNALNYATSDARGVQSYTSFKYKYSSDGTAAPSDKKIDLRYASISGIVEETVKDNLDDFAGGLNTRLPNRGSQIGGDTFDPNFYSGNNRGSTPSDDFTQTEPTDPDSPTTPAPSTTAAPTTTTAAPTTTTTTTAAPTTTTAAPAATTVSPNQVVGGNTNTIPTLAPPTCPT